MRFPRLINASASDFEAMGPMDLKRSVEASEGRVIMGQHLLFKDEGLVRSVTNTELMCAFGADMVMLNTMNLDNIAANPGLRGLSFAELKQRCRRPIGVYLGCTPAQTDPGTIYFGTGMTATPGHVEACLDMGVDFLVLGGNPGCGTQLSDVIRTTREIKERYGARVFLFSGKWEDGVTEPVLGDPRRSMKETKSIIRELIDAGADCIDLPCPGTRPGVTVEDIRELVLYVHTYKPGTLVMCFLNSSVEGADPDTIRAVALMMKETGADIHAIGDGGFGGCTSPENVFQLSVSIKGKPYTYFRMASTNL